MRINAISDIHGNLIDAKNFIGGDVLTCNIGTFIYYQTCPDNIEAYIYYNPKNGSIMVENFFKVTLTTDPHNCFVHPASKEQRDALFQKMKEEGYEWNVEKKELKRLIKTHKVMSRQHHELKIKTKYFREIESGDKTFEVRYNDRNFQKYDILHLREYADGEYTSRKIDAEVTYILYDKEFCKEGYVIMAIKVINVIN